MKRDQAPSELAAPENSYAGQRFDEVEAIFGAQLPPRDGSPKISVVVKRRRLPVSQDGDSSHPGEASSDSAPRVFRVAAKSTEGRSNAQDSKTEFAAPKRRRRRSRHGQVTIIRPEFEASRLPGTEQRRADTGEVVAVSLPNAVPLDFGVDPEADRRYQRLAARIEKLQVQAVAARKREAAVAVRWIRRAIAEYGIKARDLGFSR